MHQSARDGKVQDNPQDYIEIAVPEEIKWLSKQLKKKGYEDKGLQVK